MPENKDDSSTVNEFTIPAEDASGTPSDGQEGGSGGGSGDANRVAEFVPRPPSPKVSYQSRDQTQAHLVYFDAPFEKDQADKGTEVIGFRVPVWLARELDDVVEAARVRKMCVNRHRMLKWMVYRGIVEVAKVLKDPEISDMAALLEEQVERIRRREMYQKYERALTSAKVQIESDLSRNPPFVISAERELAGLLRRLKGIEDAEWKEAFLRSVRPLEERVEAVKQANALETAAGPSSLSAEGGDDEK